MSLMHKRLVLNLYRSKLKICYYYGYDFGDWKYNIKKDFNLEKALMKTQKIKNEKKKATFIMNHIRQTYKDQKYLNEDYIIDMYIDEGFRALRKLDNLFF